MEKLSSTQSGTFPLKTSLSFGKGNRLKKEPNNKPTKKSRTIPITQKKQEM